MRNGLKRSFAGIAVGGLAACLSSGAQAISLPPPSAPTIDSAVLDVFGVATVARCETDSFRKEANAGYQDGNAYNPRNVDNRREWAGPTLSTIAWRRLDYYSDPATAKIVPREYPNRLYPSFATDKSAENPQGSLDQKYPVWYPRDTEGDRVTAADRQQNPTMFTANQSFRAQALESGVVFFTGCREGCLTGWQKVEYVSGEVPIEDAEAATKRDLVTLGADATAERLTYMANDVESYSKDVYATEQDIIRLHTESGGVLELTPKHPLLVGTGSVKTAEELAIGDALVRADGTKDPVSAVEKARNKVQTFNVMPKTSSAKTNLLVVEGYLVGSQRLQDELATIEQREMLREYVFPEDAAL